MVELYKNKKEKAIRNKNSEIVKITDQYFGQNAFIKDKRRQINLAYCLITL